MAWIKFYQGQSAVNTRYLVSAKTVGREDHCQILFKDCNGDEYRSDFFNSFPKAEEAIRKFLSTAVTEEEGPLAFIYEGVRNREA